MFQSIVTLINIQQLYLLHTLLLSFHMGRV